MLEVPALLLNIRTVSQKTVLFTRELKSQMNVNGAKCLKWIRHAATLLQVY